MYRQNSAEWRILSLTNEISKDILSISEGDLQKILREIKDRFLERNYQAIFSDVQFDERLLTYFVYYTPSRAICYSYICRNSGDGLIADIISGRDRLRQIERTRRRQSRLGNHENVPDDIFESFNRITKIACIGAGAGAEILGIYDTYCAELNDTKWPLEGSGEYRDLLYSEFASKISGSHSTGIDINILDMGCWDKIIEKINSNIRNDAFKLHFYRRDILDLTEEEIHELICCGKNLITMMFVLNELFQANKARAAQFITHLVKNLEINAYLLIVESAGSFSEIKVGNRDFMVFHLLDRVNSLEKVHSCDSTWHRISQQVKENYRYPLNDMRYFIRIYKKR